MAGVTTYLKETRNPARQNVLSVTVTIDDTALDSGHTSNTHILRKGLVVGIITASEKYAQYDDTASDGTEVAKGILMVDVDLKDGDPTATATDHTAPVMVLGEAVSTECIGHDANATTDLVGKIWF